MLYYYFNNSIYLNGVCRLLIKINMIYPNGYYVMWFLKMSRICLL